MIDYPPGLNFEEQQHLKEHGWEYTPQVPDKEKQAKIDSARNLFIESVLKPDHQLRQCAHNQKCYNELMEVRDHVLDYLGYYGNKA
tara:strand:+ start:754 stop:1011 length:258 start_codon:yes stop_codon:yes gene_type:complete